IGTSNLARFYGEHGDFTASETLYKELLDFQKAKLAPDHPELLRTKRGLGVMYGDWKKFDQAIPLVEEVLKHERKKYRPEHGTLLETQARLGRIYFEAGRFSDALPLFEEVHRRGAPPKVPWVNRLLLAAYVQAGKKAEAASLAAALVQE